MSWITDISRTQPMAHAILILACVSVFGLALGSLKYRGIALGSAGVLFAGILVGHFGKQVDHQILDFIKEFGLVLFVFTIGLQLGPGFIAALRQQGLQLNVLAISIVGLGALATVAGARWMNIDAAAALGVFSGATTNTPSLGAAQQTLAMVPEFPEARADLPALAYAVSYPVGIVGIIVSLLVLKAIFRIDPTQEAEQLHAQQQAIREPLLRQSVLVDNSEVQGKTLGQVAGRRLTGVTVSRIRRAGDSSTVIATAEAILHRGDVLLAVGTRDSLDRFTRIIGRTSDVDVVHSPGDVASRRVVVTRKDALGKTLSELGLGHSYGVVVTRISRADLEMTAVPDLRLRFGDVLQIVGEPEGLAQASDVLGNSVKALSETQFIPLFIGVGLGVLGGSMPLTIPGLPVPVRLGLAGGPLLAGILLSRLGHLGRLVWHMPFSVNLSFRELGITLFLAAVGLKAGERFFETVLTNTGLLWLGCAAAVATIPLIMVGVIARSALGMNFATMSGLIAGSTTDPPALAFAGLLSRSDAPHLAYATVYPLTMLMRILTAQALALLLCQ